MHVDCDDGIVVLLFSSVPDTCSSHKAQFQFRGITSKSIYYHIEHIAKCEVFHKQFQLHGSTDIHKPSHNTDRTVNVSFHIGIY